MEGPDVAEITVFPRLAVCGYLPVVPRSGLRGFAAHAARLACVVLFIGLAAGSSAEPAIPDGFWSSLLLIRDGVSDFAGKSVASYFRDVSFRDMVLPSGASTTFTLRPVSFDGKEVVIRYSILSNGVETETFDFHFKYRGTTSLLYKLSRGDAKLEGFEQMRRVMKEFYLPSLQLN